MTEQIAKVRAALDGRKTYIAVVIAVLTVVLKWSSGEIADLDAIRQIAEAAALAFIRSGVAKL
jgi:hypothetical protein